MIPAVTEGLRTLLVATAALAAGFTWQALRTASVPASSPDRLIGELRLAQVAALLLSLSAGAYIGIAAVHEARLGIGLDVAFAVGFLIVAGIAIMREPRHALTMLSLAFAAHAVLDVAHRPGVLPVDVTPRWYALGCAVFNVYVGAVTYWPMLRR